MNLEYNEIHVLGVFIKILTYYVKNFKCLKLITMVPPKNYIISEYNFQRKFITTQVK